MTFAEDGVPVEETLGPGTDLVLSLFSTYLLMGVLGAALASAPTDENKPEEPKLREGVIALDPVEDGFQHFKRQSADLDTAAVSVIVSKLRPLQAMFEEGKGKLLVHVIGHASPEPFGVDDGEANFQLALQRAMTIAGLAHRELRVPFECLRVHGYGRGESESLRGWLAKDEAHSLRGWDDLYRSKRDQERTAWPSGVQGWQAAYASGKTELGRELAGERRVVLKTEHAENDLCARALAEVASAPPPRPAPKPVRRPEREVPPRGAAGAFAPAEPERGAFDEPPASVPPSVD